METKVGLLSDRGHRERTVGTRQGEPGKRQRWGVGAKHFLNIKRDVIGFIEIERNADLNGSWATANRTRLQERMNLISQFPCRQGRSLTNRINWWHVGSIARCVIIGLRDYLWVEFFYRCLKSKNYKYKYTILHRWLSSIKKVLGSFPLTPSNWFNPPPPPHTHTHTHTHTHYNGYAK